MKPLWSVDFGFCILPNPNLKNGNKFTVFVGAANKLANHLTLGFDLAKLSQITKASLLKDI